MARARKCVPTSLRTMSQADVSAAPNFRPSSSSLCSSSFSSPSQRGLGSLAWRPGPSLAALVWVAVGLLAVSGPGRARAQQEGEGIGLGAVSTAPPSPAAMTSTTEPAVTVTESLSSSAPSLQTSLFGFVLSSDKGATAAVASVLSAGSSTLGIVDTLVDNALDTLDAASNPHALTSVADTKFVTNMFQSTHTNPENSHAMPVISSAVSAISQTSEQKATHVFGSAESADYTTILSSNSGTTAHSFLPSSPISLSFTDVSKSDSEGSFYIDTKYVTTDSFTNSLDSSFSPIAFETVSVISMPESVIRTSMFRVDLVSVTDYQATSVSPLVPGKETAAELSDAYSTYASNTPFLSDEISRNSVTQASLILDVSQQPLPSAVPVTSTARLSSHLESSFSADESISSVFEVPNGVTLIGSLFSSSNAYVTLENEFSAHTVSSNKVSTQIISTSGATPGYTFTSSGAVVTIENIDATLTVSEYSTLFSLSTSTYNDISNTGVMSDFTISPTPTMTTFMNEGMGELSIVFSSVSEKQTLLMSYDISDNSFSTSIHSDVDASRLPSALQDSEASVRQTTSVPSELVNSAKVTETTVVSSGVFSDVYYAIFTLSGFDSASAYISLENDNTSGVLRPVTIASPLSAASSTSKPITLWTHLADHDSRTTEYSTIASNATFVLSSFAEETPISHPSSAVSTSQMSLKEASLEQSSDKFTLSSIISTPASSEQFSSRVNFQSSEEQARYFTETSFSELSIYSSFQEGGGSRYQAQTVDSLHATSLSVLDVSKLSTHFAFIHTTPLESNILFISDHETINMSVSQSGVSPFSTLSTEPVSQIVSLSNGVFSLSLPVSVPAHSVDVSLSVAQENLSVFETSIHNSIKWTSDSVFASSEAVVLLPEIVFSSSDSASYIAEIQSLGDASSNLVSTITLPITSTQLSESPLNVTHSPVVDYHSTAKLAGSEEHYSSSDILTSLTRSESLTVSSAELHYSSNLTVTKSLLKSSTVLYSEMSDFSTSSTQLTLLVTNPEVNNSMGYTNSSMDEISPSSVLPNWNFFPSSLLPVSYSQSQLYSSFLLNSDYEKSIYSETNFFSSDDHHRIQLFSRKSDIYMVEPKAINFSCSNVTVNDF